MRENPAPARRASKKLVQRYIPVLEPEDGDPALSVVLLLEAINREAIKHKIVLTVSSTEQQPARLPVWQAPRSLPGRNEPPDPSGCTAHEELVSCLRQLVAWAGVSNYRELEERTKQVGHPLSKTTIGRILTDNGGELRSYKSLKSILIGCGLADAQVDAWTRAWNRCEREAGHGGEDWLRGMLVKTPRWIEELPVAANGAHIQVTMPTASPLLETVSKWSGFPRPDGSPDGRQLVIEPIDPGTGPQMQFVYRPLSQLRPVVVSPYGNGDRSDERPERQ